MSQTTQSHPVAQVVQDASTSRASLPPPYRPHAALSEQDNRQDGNTITQDTSPVHQPHDMLFNRDHSSNRMKMMGASSWACLTQTLNLYLRRGGLQPVSQYLDHGMQHAEEFHLPLILTLPALPAAEPRKRYIDIYFDRIHRLWPLFDIDATKAKINQFASMSNLESVQQDQVPLLVAAYLILSLGADEEAQNLTRDGDVYLQAASALIGHTLFMAYLPTVQSLLLLTIAFRGRNKDGLAWQTVGMAIRVAQSIGLHRFSVVRPSQDHGVTRKAEQLFHARIWGIACCLDKIMSIESGRPSPIGSVDKDQMMGSEQIPPGLNYLEWNMGIAEFQASISDHIYSHNVGSRTSRQLLLDTARLDKALLDWPNQLPVEYHPSNELFCPDEDFHIAAHLSIQYHQTMIALHRAALIAPTTQFEAEVTRQCPDEPSRFRLKGGELICVKSARSIARLMIELADKRTESRIITAGPATLACIVLAIYIAKNPAVRMQAADLELLKACASHVREQYLKSGQNEVFAQSVVVIYEEVRKYVTVMRGLPPGTDVLPQAGIPSTTSSSNADPTNGIEAIAHNNDFAKSRPQPVNNNVGASGWSNPQQSISTPVSGVPMPLAAAAASQTQAFRVQDDNSFWTNNDNNQGDLIGSQPLPFDDYNVEELWNWMLLIDSNMAPPEDLAAASRWNTDTVPSNETEQNTAS